MNEQESALATKRRQYERHEWHRGESVVMAGATRWRNMLAGRIFSAFRLHTLRGNSGART